VNESEVRDNPAVIKAKKSAAGTILDPDITAFYVFARYSDGRCYKTACGTSEFLCHAGAVATHLGVTTFMEKDQVLTESFDG